MQHLMTQHIVFGAAQLILSQSLPVDKSRNLATDVEESTLHITVSLKINSVTRNGHIAMPMPNTVATEAPLERYST